VLKGQPPPAADLDGAFEITRNLPHGHVAAVLGTARQLGLAELIDPVPSRHRDLVVAMAAAQVIAPDSKLAITRGLRGQTAASSPCEILGLGSCDEDDLYEAMDYLQARQQKIEDALAARHLAGGTLVLYDVCRSAPTPRLHDWIRGCCPVNSPSARTSLADSASWAKVVQTVVCSTFTDEAKPVTRRVADGERMKPAGRGPLEDAGDREPPRRCRYATLMLSSTSHLVLRGSVLGSVM
jgi:hypothetical protein